MTDDVQPGSRWRYIADRGLGEQARVDDPDLDDTLPADMLGLDMAPGQAVTVSGHDASRGLVLLEWTDRYGTPRVTSVDPRTFAAQFGEE